jgi:hypothetical protein
MAYYRYRDYRNSASTYGTSGMDGESNKMPVIVTVKEPVIVEGVEYFPFVAYSTGKVYDHLSIIQEDNPLHTAEYNLITASFTGFSKDQGHLYIRGTYLRKKGSVGMFVEKGDLDLILRIIKAYNEKLGYSASIVIPDPNIIDKDLFEL